MSKKQNGKCGERKDNRNQNELPEMMNKSAGYYIQQQRLLSQCISRILLTSLYMTASKLDFALPMRGQEKLIVFSHATTHIQNISSHEPTIYSNMSTWAKKEVVNCKSKHYFDWTSPLSMILCLMSFMCMGCPASSRTIYNSTRKNNIGITKTFHSIGLKRLH